MRVYWFLNFICYETLRLSHHATVSVFHNIWNSENYNRICGSSRSCEETLTFAVTWPTSADAEDSQQYRQHQQTDADNGAHNDDRKLPRRRPDGVSTWWIGNERRSHDVALIQHFTDLLYVETIGGAVHRQSLAVQQKLAQTSRHTCSKSNFKNINLHSAPWRCLLDIREGIPVCTNICRSKPQSSSGDPAHHAISLWKNWAECCNLPFYCFKIHRHYYLSHCYSTSSSSSSSITTTSSSRQILRGVRDTSGPQYTTKSKNNSKLKTKNKR